MCLLPLIAKRERERERRELRVSFFFSISICSLQQQQEQHVCETLPLSHLLSNSFVASTSSPIKVEWWQIGFGCHSCSPHAVPLPKDKCVSWRVKTKKNWTLREKKNEKKYWTVYVQTKEFTVQNGTQFDLFMTQTCWHTNDDKTAPAFFIVDELHEFSTEKRTRTKSFSRFFFLLLSQWARGGAALQGH